MQEMPEIERPRELPTITDLPSVYMIYPDHTGITQTYFVKPVRVYYGSTQQLSGPQYILAANVWECGAEKLKDFALDRCCFGPEPVSPAPEPVLPSPDSTLHGKSQESAPAILTEQVTPEDAPGKDVTLVLCELYLAAKDLPELVQEVRNCNRKKGKPFTTCPVADRLEKALKAAEDYLLRSSKP